MNDKELQNLLDRLALLETQNMLRILALNFSEKTRMIPLREGTKQYKLVTLPRLELVDNSVKPATCVEVTYEIIDIVPFFGAHIGYSAKQDVLVYWVPS